MQEIWDLGLIPGSGRPLGGGHGNPLQYAGLENLMDKGAWQATVHSVVKSQTPLSDEHIHRHALLMSRPTLRDWVNYARVEPGTGDFLKPEPDPRVSLTCNWGWESLLHFLRKVRERREHDKGWERNRENKTWSQGLCLVLVIAGIWKKQEANTFYSSRGRKVQESNILRMCSILSKTDVKKHFWRAQRVFHFVPNTVLRDAPAYQKKVP